MMCLIKKDFMLLRKYMIFIIIIAIALPAALAGQSNEVNILQSTLAFALEVIYCEFLVCRYLAMKEYQYPRASGFLCTLPYTRNMQVVSKYLIYLAVFAFCCVTYGIDTLFFPDLCRLNAESVITALFVASILYGVYMPVQYRFGYDKSKLIFMFLLIAFPLLASKINTEIIIKILSKLTFPLMSVLTVGVLVLSLLVSVRIFNGKEL